MALTPQDFHALGYSHGKEDAINGFNTASRKAMMEQVQSHCPALLRLFSHGYCIRLQFRYQGKWIVIQSQQGSRMGCKLGSLVFIIAVQPAYLETQRRRPRVVIRAATNDVHGGVLHPDNPNNPHIEA